MTTVAATVLAGNNEGPWWPRTRGTILNRPRYQLRRQQQQQRPSRRGPRPPSPHVMSVRADPPRSRIWIPLPTARAAARGPATSACASVSAGGRTTHTRAAAAMRNRPPRSRWRMPTKAPWTARLGAGIGPPSGPGAGAATARWCAAGAASSKVPMGTSYAWVACRTVDFFFLFFFPFQSSGFRKTHNAYAHTTGQPTTKQLPQRATAVHIVHRHQQCKQASPLAHYGTSDHYLYKADCEPCRVPGPIGHRLLPRFTELTSERLPQI